MTEAVAALWHVLVGPVVVWLWDHPLVTLPLCVAFVAAAVWLSVWANRNE